MHRHISKLLFFICFVLVSASGMAQQEDSLMIRRIADEILVNGKAYDNLRILCKTVGPRLAGSPGMLKAEAWGVKTLKEAGADKVWLQECMVPRWVRGGKDEAYFTAAGKKVSLDVLALGNSQGTGAKGLSAPVILIHSFEELEQRKEEIKGKIVFYNYKFNPRFVKTFQSYGDASRYRGQGASRAAKYGAVGVLVRSMSHSTDNHPHTGAMNYDTAYAKIPAAAVGLKDADLLAATLEKNK
jgi:carboxypeptidase Q